MLTEGLLLQAIIQNAIDGIIIINQYGIIEDVNPAVIKMFKFTESEMIGKNISMLMPPPHRTYHDQYIDNYKKTGKANIIGIGREVMGQKKDGSIFPFKLGVSEIEYGERRIFVGLLHDLSKEKEAEEKLKNYASELEKLVAERTQSLADTVNELKNAKEELKDSLDKEKELNQMKTRFVSIASHEFRTPLSAISLSASLINKYTETKDCDSIQKHVVKIKSGVNHLTDILNDFLSLDKMEEGKIYNTPSEFDLIKFAETIIEEMQAMAKPGQNIVYQHTGKESMVTIDPGLLKHSIYNLISNALKYSGENTLIEFNSETRADGFTITIKDNGIGIPEADQKHLFEPFFRAHNTVNIQGTGLGLNIVKKYINLMGGKIKFNSAENQGATFILEFPNK
jgi:two-component system, LuxR family, sensor kinase FixL